MRRWVVGSIVLLVPLLLQAPASAAKATAQCGDIVRVTGEYSAGHQLGVVIETPVARCRGGVEFNLLIEGVGDDTWHASKWGESWFSFTIPDDDDTVCIWTFTGTTRGYDRAPDSGCLALTAGMGPATATDPLGDLR